MSSRNFARTWLGRFNLAPPPNNNFTTTRPWLLMGAILAHQIHLSLMGSLERKNACWLLNH